MRLSAAASRATAALAHAFSILIRSCGLLAALCCADAPEARATATIAAIASFMMGSPLRWVRHGPPSPTRVALLATETAVARRPQRRYGTATNIRLLARVCVSAFLRDACCGLSSTMQQQAREPARLVPTLTAPRALAPQAANAPANRRRHCEHSRTFQRACRHAALTRTRVTRPRTRPR